MNFCLRWIALALIVACPGCVAAWGDSFNVALANSSSIVIEYDPAVVDVPRMLETAQDHCEQFNRDAILDSSTTGNLGIKVNTYRCIDR